MAVSSIFCSTGFSSDGRPHRESPRRQETIGKPMENMGKTWGNHHVKVKMSESM